MEAVLTHTSIYLQDVYRNILMETSTEGSDQKTHL